MKVQNAESKTSRSELDTSRLLSESESCSISGITLDTIRSYTQFGLLKPVIRNQKPFYRLNELTLLFNIQESVPTLDKLLAPEEAAEEEVVIEEIVNSKINEPQNIKNDNLPALRIEDVMLQNQSLNTQIKSLEDERDWLRKRVEMLEERSAREQMLMLKEKETLSEIINATLVKDSREPRKPFSFKSYIKRIALPFFSEK